MFKHYVSVSFLSIESCKIQKGFEHNYRIEAEQVYIID